MIDQPSIGIDSPVMRFYRLPASRHEKLRLREDQSDTVDYVEGDSVPRRRMTAGKAPCATMQPVDPTLYNGPDVVYRAVAPHLDGFWVNVFTSDKLLRIYNASHKPLLEEKIRTAGIFSES